MSQEIRCHSILPGDAATLFSCTENQPKKFGCRMFRCTKEEVLWKRKTSSFFVVSGSLWKGLEQPVRPPCVPAGADSPADCPQGRGRVPSSAPKMRFCGNAKPHLFLSFPEISGRDSNSPSGRPASRHTKSSEPARFASHRRCFLSAIAPFGDCPRQKKAPGLPELGAGRAGGFAVFH